MQCTCSIFFYMAYRLYNIFNYLINGAIFEKKKLLVIKCVFWFFLQLLYETFLILRITERDMIINVIVLYVKYPSLQSEFN